MGLLLILWIALSDRIRDEAGIQFIKLFMLPALFLIGGGVYFLVKAGRAKIGQ